MQKNPTRRQDFFVDRRFAPQSRRTASLKVEGSLLSFDFRLLSSKLRLSTQFVVLIVEDELVQGLVRSLRLEGGLVCSDRRDVLHTSLSSACSGCEHRLLLTLVSRELGTGVRVRLADVQVRAVRACRRRFTVRTNQVIAVVVAIHFLRFCQATLHVLDTWSIGYFSHRVRHLVARTESQIH